MHHFRVKRHTKCFAKAKNIILEKFLSFFSKLRIFLKNSAASVFDP